MRLLICSDGTETADKPAHIGGIVAGACRAEVTLLGIAEREPDEPALRRALETEAATLRKLGVEPAIVLRHGEPIAQILHQTVEEKSDLVVVGARGRRISGEFTHSPRTYEVIKAIPAPVLIATGRCDQVAKFLVCTGGKKYIDDAVKLTGEIAACAGASVTLLHVMAEPPAIYADLARLEEDVEGLLAGESELGRNLRTQKEGLEKLGVPVAVRVRQGFVLDEVFRELAEGDYDLIVTGSSQARGPLRHYIMGDITRSIVNRARCPVLVARPAAHGGGGIWSAFKNALGLS